MSGGKAAWPMWEKVDEGGNAIPQESDLSVGMKWMLDRSLQNERDFWSEKCMQEIQNISISLGDRLRQVEVALDNRPGEESISTGHIDMIVDQKLAAERTRLLAERAEQFAALAELRRDLGVQRDHEAMVSELRKDLGTAQAAIAELARKSSVAGSEGAVVGESMMEASLKGLREDIDITQQRTMNSVSDMGTQLRENSMQMDAQQAAVQDLRKEMREQREAYDLQSNSAKALIEALRRELSSLQMDQEKFVQPLRREIAHVQAEQQKALGMQADQVRSLEPLLRETVARSSGELSRGIDAMTSAIEKVEATLRSELKQEIERIRAEVDAERSQADEFAAYVAKAEVSSLELARRVEESERKIKEMAQDQKAEIVSMRAIMEANVGDRDDQTTKTSSLEREQIAMLSRLDELGRKVSIVSDMQNAPAVMPPEVAGMSARLDALERLCKDAPNVVATTAAAQTAADVSPNVAVTAAVAAKAMGEVSAVRAALDSTSREVTRLAESLAEERQERRQAISEMNRSGGENERSAAAQANDKGNEGLRAELRAEVSSRIALAETRVSGLEVSMWTEVKRVATDLGARIVRLESGSSETKLTQRVTTLEGEVRRTSLLVNTFLEERSMKRDIAADPIEMALRQGLRGAGPGSNPDDTLGSQDSTNLDVSRTGMSQSSAADQRTPSVSKALSVGDSSSQVDNTSALGDVPEESLQDKAENPRSNSWLSGVKRLLNINTPAPEPQMQPQRAATQPPMQIQPSAVMATPGGSTNLPMGGGISGGSTTLPLGMPGGSMTVGSGMTGGSHGDGTPISKASSDAKNRMPGDLKESLAGLMTAVQRTLREQEDGPEEMDVLTQLDQMRRDPSPMIGGSRRGLYAQSRSPSRAHSPQVEGMGRVALSGARKPSQEPRLSADARAPSFDMSSGSNAQPAWAQPREGSFVGNRGKMRSESANQRRQSPAMNQQAGRGSSTLPIGPGPAQTTQAASRGQSLSAQAADAPVIMDSGAAVAQSPTSAANVRSTSGSVRTQHQATNRQSLMSTAFGATGQVGYTPQVNPQVLRARGATPLSAAQYTPQAQTRSVRPSM